MRLDDSHRTEIMKVGFKHAVMHISVYTDAFDNRIHRIKYLNKYKKIKRAR